MEEALNIGPWRQSARTALVTRLTKQKRRLYARLMPRKKCRVLFKDVEGVVHSTEVEAESLYEAAALGLRVFKRAEWMGDIGAATRITVQIHEPPVEHFLMYAQLETWLRGSAKSPAEQVVKKRLREMLAS